MRRRFLVVVFLVAACESTMFDGCQPPPQRG
jgi:hypothetical protein